MVLVACGSYSPITNMQSDTFADVWRARQARWTPLLTSLLVFACLLFSSLLVFEQARNYLQFEQNRFDVVGGFLSPVHDAYGKSSLIPHHHRQAMCELAVKDSEWMSVQSWELKQKGWTTTADTLCKYQAAINQAHLTDRQPHMYTASHPFFLCLCLLAPVLTCVSAVLWCRLCVCPEPIRVKLLCGADLLESTLIPNLWSKDDVSAR